MGFTSKGKFLGIEVKKPGGVVSEEQAAIIRKINEAGGIGLIVFSLDEVKGHLDHI